MNSEEAHARYRDLPGAGLEPAWPCGRGILSPLRVLLSCWFRRDFSLSENLMCKKMCKSEVPHKSRGAIGQGLGRIPIRRGASSDSTSRLSGLNHLGTA